MSGSNQRQPGSKSNPRGERFDQQLYGDGADYAEAIDEGAVDEREAELAAKMAAAQRRSTANSGTT